MNRFKLLSSSVLFRKHLSDQQAIPPSSVQAHAANRTSHSFAGSPCPLRVRQVMPKSYVASYAYPLIVWFHSDGDNENQINSIAPHLSLQNYVYLGLRGTVLEDRDPMTFNWSSTPASIARCEDNLWRGLDDIASKCNIHPRRIFLAGYGAGATMAREIAYRHSSHFAGCIALGGRMPRGNNAFADLTSLRQLRQFWAVAIDNPDLNDAQFDEDIDLAAMAGLRLDVNRYTTDDEMVTEVLRDVNHWVMDLISGKQDSKRWDSRPTRYSAN